MAVTKEEHDGDYHQIVLQGTIHQIKVFDTGQEQYPLMMDVFGIGGEVSAMLEHEDIVGLHRFLGQVLADG